MMRVLQRDSSLPLLYTHSTQLAALPRILGLASKMHGPPVRGNAEKRVMLQPGSSLALLSGRAAASNGGAARCHAWHSRQQELHAGVCER